MEHNCKECICFEDCKRMCLNDDIVIKCIFYQELKNLVRENIEISIPEL